MTTLTALVIGVLFGTGTYAMAHRDVIRLAGGTLLIGNAAILFLMAPTVDGREAAILPVERIELVADPLVQALALTAIVINFGTSVLLLRVALTVEETHETLNMDDLAEAEVRDEAEEEAAADRANADGERAESGGGA